MSMADVCLQGARAITLAGPSRAAVTMRAGRFGGTLGTGSLRLDLQGHVLAPGLINAHDHLQVNCVPPLPQGAPFANSYAWIEAFQAHFQHPDVAAALRVPKAVRLRHGGLKNLLAGVTCVAQHDPWHATLDETNFPVGLLREFGWSYALGWTGYGPPVQGSFAATSPEHPWMIHLAEGTDAVAGAELDELDRLGCLASNSVLIHGVGMGECDIDRVIARGAAVVWCPSSNLALLGRTLDPWRLCMAGRLALGNDSRISGARDLLEELRIAADSGLAPDLLLGMVSQQSARILRMQARGCIAPGAAADLLIVRDRGGDPATSVIGCQRNELRAVIRDGAPRIADPDFADWFEAAGIQTVPVLLDGRPKLLDARLADPAVLALEPGLECVPHAAQAPSVAMAANGAVS
ncbi:amidohydrolase family protein [Xanthomonas hortorum pv. vitians]|uniref:5'-deoxyadenosine deaminase n=1 Tax=Xanthomonas hortorum pv. vitians TaxID=83224 RepID=A0A6V7EGF1_9XANT|nr:amidohydrolase family protein [Xanthomonas hortorum]MCC8492936.1 amidohydrolase family protein [Xanthomonas hortorum pv. gardneri]MCE4282110.1 amidohydrolase family protein [Xanthomonas hortorum pv. vitians]MCE4287269.1 amidohydrolase family protein [Xanthomonas hortorum pv. vitians]MCE4291746.1 amidohydrolase family protein [Xanthomonas hortorum pv. vitians]MCE4293503.1 amidohydrolase family protein [Xanthomonas hortorum pv. vitians]